MLPRGNDRFVCKQLSDRRDYPVLSVIEALDVLKQPNLLETETTSAKIHSENEETSKINAIIAPVSFIDK